MPSLWTQIALDDRVDMWRERMRRARGLPLDIRLHEPTRSAHLWSAERAARALHPALAHVRRWRSFSVRLRTRAPYQWNAVLSPLCGSGTCAPALEALELVYPANDDTKAFALFGGHAPRLRRVVLAGVRLVWTPALFARVEVLDYTHHGFSQGAVAVTEISTALAACPTLGDLRLALPANESGRIPLSGIAGRGHSIKLPYLHALRVDVLGRDLPGPVHTLLTMFDCPRMRALRLAHIRPPAGGAFANAHAAVTAFGPLPWLEHLTLENGWASTQAAHALAQNAPRLRAICLNMSGRLPEVVAVRGR
jgi:hypothetical protein